MNNICSLHRPRWQLFDGDWFMLVGNRIVAKLTPEKPPYAWLSFTDIDYEEHGWHAVAFKTLSEAQHDMEQWWDHMLQGETYDP